MISCAQRFCVDCAVNAKPYVERRAAMDKNLLGHLIKEKENKFADISDKIGEYAEPGVGELKSVEIQIECLRKQGGEITENIANIPTAFQAHYGSGRPVIAFLGEYDALPMMSQVADITEKKA